ncbi:uncharacterized protein LOC144120065 [Amblyomma americanum]
MARLSPVGSVEEQGRQRLQDLVSPYRVGGDTALFLVNFERACGEVHIDKSAWSEKLLLLLPCEAAEVVARLTRGESDDYEKVKSALLKKYRLSAEAFWQRFRQAKKGGESQTDFAYRLKVHVDEWLKTPEVHGSHDNVLGCITLEQYYSAIPEDLRIWLQDRLKDIDLDKAAQLADEYYVRENLQSKAGYDNRLGKGEAYLKRIPDQRVPPSCRDHRKEDAGSKGCGSEKKIE